MKKVLSVGVVTALLMIGLVKLTLCFYNDDAKVDLTDARQKNMSGWTSENGSWYYTAGGSYQTGWLQLGNTWYYLNAGSGAMQTGWVDVNGTWYYMDGSGAMQTGWADVNGTWYYMDGSGAMQTGWADVNDTWYYMDGSGAMQTGWADVNGTWYYMDGSGAMQTGWVDVNGTWYYMDGSGAMRTGWENIGGTWYYLRADGTMATTNIMIDGKMNAFAANGAWLGEVVTKGASEEPGVHVHEYSDWQTIQAATCVADGTEKRSCMTCGAEETRTVAAKGHDYSAWTVEKAASCTEAGVQTATCTVCGSKQTNAIPALGHSCSGWTVEKAATCTAQGMESCVCTTCGAKQTRTLSALGHKFGAWTTEQAATCTAQGTEKQTCTACGLTQIRTVSAMGHRYGTWKTEKAATCTAEGLQSRTCTVCADRMTRTVAMKPHDFNAWKDIRRATCIEGGRRERTCKNCDYTEIKETTINANAHVVGSDIHVVKEATCDSWGEKEYTCELCHNTVSVPIPMIHHIFADEVVIDKLPTCTEAGSRSRHCTREGCNGRTDIETIEPTGHTWAEELEEFPATCTVRGARFRVCIDCGKKERVEILPATGHKYSEYTSNNDATCLGNATESRTCEYCGQTQTRTIPGTALGHEMIWVEGKEPTHESYGWEPFMMCDRCGYGNNNKVILEPCQHNWSDWVPTYECGHSCCPIYWKKVCTDPGCDQVKEYKFEPGTGHTWDEEMIHCTVCGLDTSRWSQTSVPDESLDQYRQVWGITYVVDMTRSEGFVNYRGTHVDFVTKTIIGKAQVITMAPPEPKPGYRFVGWRQLGVEGAELDTQTTLRSDHWYDCDKAFEAVFEPIE